MRRLVKSFGYALSGITYTVKTQMNFRIHLAIILLVGIAGWYFRLSAAEWVWIVLTIGLVLVAELLNTAIELLVDLVSPGFDVQAGRVKDIAAGAVLVAAGISVVTGLIIFVPKFI
ncbi:diacylglycerol kinase family protein [Pedobacter hartonius]|uniref:Undecaprenol kinase/diacylglycerol kinase (ATP) n=1 Tax=Pedobacter hartonius TaxID=425514 RepID=A0A1H3Z1P2_9SPHI|nr:diacylglycerol kinase family protein [Pedobacter hartonius]SEA17590.1 undecaprenol kinase/diacylglycerol kinase (ATP) [Pedobacter hartonius]